MRWSQGIVIPMIAICFAVGMKTAGAANITWANPSTISSVSDVSTLGSLVAAYNIGNTGVSATTINGVPFAAFPIANGSMSATNGLLKVEGFQGTVAINSASALDSANAPFTSLNANYQTMLSTGAVQSSISTPILDLTFSGLTVGNAYSVEIWANDSRVAFSGRNVGVSDFNGNNKLMDSNTTDTNGGVGQFILGGFVADATTEFISVSSGDFGASAIFNGIQLRTTSVPEPSTLILGIAGLAGLGFVALRKKFRRA